MASSIEEDFSLLDNSIDYTEFIFDESIEYIGFSNASPFEIGFSKVNSTQVSPFKVSVDQSRSKQTGIFKISPSEVSSTQIDFGKIGFSQIGFLKSDISKISNKTNITQVGSTQISSTQVNSTQASSAQVDFSQVNSTKIDLSEVGIAHFDSAKISFSRSISSEQFFPIHNSTPEITNVLNNTATNIWSDLLQSSTQLDIDFQITDLPTGQLAEATITGFDDNGTPNAGTILIDHDANGVGWFIDETPLENSEFGIQSSESYLLAAAESDANGKYDLLTTVLHELAHLYGFIEGYDRFDRLVSEGWGEVVFDGSHLDKEAHPNDSMNSHLAPGVRKLPSQVDVEILQAILKVEGRGQKAEGELEAALSSEPLLAISNGDFEIADPTADTFAWNTRGASNIENGQAVLTEDSPFLSNFTQTFTVPEEAKTVKFKLIDAQLGVSELAPPDAFEVALLDANTNESLVTDNDLTATDSLLNIQNDGTAYFSDKVRIKGATSGEIIELDKSHTITVDISHLAAGTEATLYFDLLGFGDVDSRVVIDDVELSDQNLVPPIATNDTATTTQRQPVIIDILANDTDDDGTIAPDSVEIQTDPSNGTVIPRPDGTVSYIPDSGFAGNDSFTYVVRDNDGQLSEPATVEVTVANAIPEIVELQLPDTIIEGVQVNFGATVTDGGNDLLTYTWDIDNNRTLYERRLVRPYENNGTYTGTLIVTSSYGDSDTRSFDIVVDSTLPIVDVEAIITAK